MKRLLTSLAVLALGLSGCASVPEGVSLDAVEGMTSTRMRERIHWRSGSAEDELADQAVRELLSAALTVDAAVQVALLTNRSLQASYEKLGIAQADLVQAGLLRNPVFSGRVRFPDRPPSGTNLELAVVQDFLDVLTLSARKSLAAGQLEAVELEVALNVLDLAAHVREASIAALGAKQMAAMRKLVVDAAQASAELARRLHEAGNISDLQLAGELGLYESARVAWARADAERLAAREELSGMMGLWGENLAWTLPDSLPEIPAEEVDLQQIESVAVAGRLDLLLARKESDLIAGALGLTRDWRFLALAEVGVSTERDSDGQWLTGPELSLELPIFDQGQARTARLVAQLRQADQHVFALAVEIRSEVRVLRERLLALRRLTEHYRTVVIPLRESIVAFTKQEFDYMLVGAFELIGAKQAEYDAYQEYIESIRDYWTTRFALEAAVGGSFTAPMTEMPRARETHHPEGH